MAKTNNPRVIGENVNSFFTKNGTKDSGPMTERADVYVPAPPLSSSRYNRQMLVPNVSISGQERIARSSILIIGLGGLGSPAALYLAGAGVGKLGFLDNDTVELSNLHRQVVHRESSVKEGMTKVQSAIRGCKEVNGDIEFVPHEMRLDVSTTEKVDEVLKIFDKYDLVLDCTDNPATRYLISDFCVLKQKTLVSGAAQRLEGQMLVLNYSLANQEERGPCYRCVFPKPPSPEMVRGCSEIGILGPVVGTIGVLMASEAVRLIVKGEIEPRKPAMLLYNAWPTDPKNMFRTIGLRGKRKDCLACGSEEYLRSKQLKKISTQEFMEGRMDYVAFCGVLEDVKLLRPENRIEATDFLAKMTEHGTNTNGVGDQCDKRWNNATVVDVREPYEVEMGSKIKHSINIPISTFLRQESPGEELDALVKSTNDSALVFVCPQGNDSQVAAKKVIDWRTQTGLSDIASLQEHATANDVFIGDVIGGFVAIDRARSRLVPTSGGPG